MNNIMKFAIAAGVTAVGVGVTVHYVKKCKERKYVEMKDVAAQAVENDHKNDSPLEKVKNFAMKKAVKFMTFVLLHEKEVTAVATVLSLVGAVFHIVNEVKEYRLGKHLRKKLDGIYNRIDKVGYYIEDCTGVINNNLRVVDGDIIKIGDKLGVQILQPGEVL